MSADILAKPFSDIINMSFSEDTFPSKAKMQAVLPIFKKGDRSDKNNNKSPEISVGPNDHATEFPNRVLQGEFGELRA